MIRSSMILASSPEDLANQLEEKQGTATVALAFAEDRILGPDYLNSFAGKEVEVFGSCAAEPIFQDSTHSGVAVMLLDIPSEAFALRIFEPTDSSFALGESIATYARSRFTNPALIMLVAAGDLVIAPEDLLHGILQILPMDAVFGGIPSSIGVLDRPPFFDDKKFYEAGVYALIIDQDCIEIQGMAVSGWKELGTPKRITRSEGRKVLEIEGIPATDFYSAYFDLKSPRSGNVRNHIDPDLLAAGEYPLLLRRDDNTEVMRAAIQMDADEKAVYYGGEIPEGSLVRFCSPNSLETIDHSLAEMKAFRNDIRKKPDAVLLFNCALRSRSFGPYMNRELEAISKLWQAPVVGFSSWGEIGRTGSHNCGLHNTVISVVTLRDKMAGELLASTHDDSQVDGGFSPGSLASEGSGETFSLEPLGREQTVEELRAELDQLRREKRILGHFLRLTSSDLQREQEKSDELLLNILPDSIARDLKSGTELISSAIDTATVLFADLVGFTELSSRMDSASLVGLLNELFSAFDQSARKLGVEKIKTIGDAYMAASGVPEPASDHAVRCLHFAESLFPLTEKVNKEQGTALRLRVGMHSGPLTAGVIGKHKFTYDLWGDTVNVAQRMEAHGKPGCIQVSEETFLLLGKPDGWNRTLQDLKGKGPTPAYMYERANMY